MVRRNPGKGDLQRRLIVWKMKKMVPEGNQVPGNTEGVYGINRFGLPEKQKPCVPMFHNDPVHFFLKQPGLGVLLNRRFKGYASLRGKVISRVRGCGPGTGIL